MDLTRAILTDHAMEGLAKRGISEEQLRLVLAEPETVLPVRPGRVVAQGMMTAGRLLRVFVDIDRTPPEIVTAYLTSKLDKYRVPDES